MDGLEIRAAAAVDLARTGLLDGALALSYVLWPTEAVEAASEAAAAEGAVPGRHRERTRLRALELVEAGWSWAEAGREVGVAKTTAPCGLPHPPPLPGTSTYTDGSQAGNLPPLCSSLHPPRGARGR